MPIKRASEKAKSDNVFGHARRPTKMFRAGLYARVSTNDQQTLAMQSRAMREYAARRGWTIAVNVREVGSGAAKREAREKLLEAARRREIDVVLVWRLDRWGRSVTEGTGASRRGLRVADRGIGPDYAGRSSDGRSSGDFR
jgi:predicted site-specific integrase-resolvase